MMLASPQSYETLLADLWSYGVAGLGAVPCPVASLPEMTETWGAVAEGGGDCSLTPPAFHRVSVSLRQTVADLGVVVADGRVLGAMAALTKPAPMRCLVLPHAVSSEGFAGLLTRKGRTLAGRKRLLLREARRQALGLSASREPDEIEAAIYAAYVLPAVQRVFDNLYGAGRVWVTASSCPLTHPFAPLVARADDPLSDNVYALAMKTGFFGPNARAVKPWMSLSPAHFRRLLRACHPPDPGLQSAALSVAQISLLWPAKARLPSAEKGLSHV